MSLTGWEHLWGSLGGHGGHASICRDDTNLLKAVTSTMKEVEKSRCVSDSGPGDLVQHGIIDTTQRFKSGP